MLNFIFFLGISLNAHYNRMNIITGNILFIELLAPPFSSLKLEYELLAKNRSSYRRCSIKKGVLKKFSKFTGKQLCQCPFVNKVAGLRKKRLWQRCFPVNFVNFLQNKSEQLLLKNGLIKLVVVFVFFYKSEGAPQRCS